MRISRVKAALATALLTAAAVGGVTLIGLTPALAGSPNSAKINPDFTCTLMDGNGNSVTTNQSLSVITISGNTTYTCIATGVTPSSTGNTVLYEDFPCQTFLGLTTNSRETVSASGKASLTCWVH